MGAGMRLRGFLTFLPPLSFPQADGCFSVGSELSVHTPQQQRLLSLAVDTAGCPDPEAMCVCGGGGSSAAPPTTLRRAGGGVAQPWAERKPSHLQGHCPHLAGARVG